MSGLIAVLGWIEGDGLALFWSGFLCFVRIGAALALLPAFGERSVPMRVRIGVTLALTMTVAPAVGQPVDPTPSAILAETVIGLALGAGFRLLVIALQTAGAMAAQATSLAQIFASAGAEPQSAMANLLGLAGLALICATGLHIRVIEVLILSHEVLPQGQWPAATAMTEWGVVQVGRSFALATTLAAPFMIGGLLYNVALGAINRAMPMLMVVFVGAPALTAGGMILLAVAAPMLLAAWLQIWFGWLADPFTTTR